MTANDDTVQVGGGTLGGFRAEVVSNGGKFVVLLGTHAELERARELAAVCWVGEFVMTYEHDHGPHAHALWNAAVQLAEDTHGQPTHEGDPNAYVALRDVVHDHLRTGAPLLMPEGASVMQVVAS